MPLRIYRYLNSKTTLSIVSLYRRYQAYQRFGYIMDFQIVLGYIGVDHTPSGTERFKRNSADGIAIFEAVLKLAKTEAHYEKD